MSDPNGGKTGWPPGLLQDDCKGLSRWFASRPDAREVLRRGLHEMMARSGEIARAAIKAEQERHDAIWGKKR